MSARIKYMLLLSLGMILLPLSRTAAGAALTPLSQETLADELGWVPSDLNNCGGYYLEQPFVYPESADKKGAISVTGSQALFAQHGTTVLEGKVSMMRHGQQITANKAYLYRNQETGKFSTMDLLGDVHLREPNTLVVAKRGKYNFTTHSKSLMDILFRTAIDAKEPSKKTKKRKITDAEMEQERKLTSLTAWGKAEEFEQTEPKVYELYRSSFTTCPPVHPAWRVKSSHLVLDKNNGRGYATHARIFIKDVPIAYVPYFPFSIDKQRKSGFMWPTVGTRTKTSNIYAGWGTYTLLPFYWNMAPNYDMTITPGYLSWRGVRIADKLRYLDTMGRGEINFSVLPNDQMFQSYQEYATDYYAGTTNDTTQANLTRLLNASTTRKSFSWRDNTFFNRHWSTHLDFNYVGDDYYLRDFGSNNNDVTQNQLLQEGDLYYKGVNWNFIGRLQTYQTMHPVDGPPVTNAYRRAPQLILDGDYPDQAYGLEYFIKTEATHFDIRNTPGTAQDQPFGQRFHLQPGISLPMYYPYFFVNPRVQLSMTKYSLAQTTPTQTDASAQRTIPIFDMAIGGALSRNTTLFNRMFEQTLEPQVYYTYIPYRNQFSIPVFDTTVSTLTYDQIFNYNRFSGIDRIGDANQIGFGISSSFIDAESGLEKVRMGIGEIIYFANRRITLCNNNTCTDNPENPANDYRLSPISGLLKYNVNPLWSLESNAIFNPIEKQLDNATIGLHYKSDETHIVNLGFGYLFNGDPQSGSTAGFLQNNNLKLTDFSFVWPITADLSAIGRWSQNWNQQHLQDLLYGLQYDTCCWAMRFVGGRTFTNLDPNQNYAPKYTPEFYIQFALKGLGNVGSDPTGLLNSISGYKTEFGQEF